MEHEWMKRMDKLANLSYFEVYKDLERVQVEPVGWESACVAKQAVHDLLIKFERSGRVEDNSEAYACRQAHFDTDVVTS